jgi:hypothetical protein
MKWKMWYLLNRSGRVKLARDTRKPGKRHHPSLDQVMERSIESVPLGGHVELKSDGLEIVTSTFSSSVTSAVGLQQADQSTERRACRG